MTELPSTRYQRLDGPAIVQALALDMSRAPLVSLRFDVLDLPGVLRVPLRVLAFDTELMGNGILGFIENTPPHHLHETIEAFAAIGATHTAETLRAIEAACERHGIDIEQLHTENAKDERAVSTFSQRHGSDADTFADEVCDIADALYMYGDNDVDGV